MISLFADVGTGIYRHAASQYHARPRAKRGIAMPSLDKIPYPRKQAKGNDFIPCSNDVCHILKRFRGLNLRANPFLWPKSSYDLSVARLHFSDKKNGRRPPSPRDLHCDVINGVPLSSNLTLMTSNVKYVSILHGY